jgi:CRISPR-associated protein Csx3
MAAYTITMEGGNLLQVGFGEPADNDRIVRDAEKRLDELIDNGEITGGELIRIFGPASLPVAMVLAHKLNHLYQAVACFDPKLKKYVVAIAHGDRYRVGDLVD